MSKLRDNQALLLDVFKLVCEHDGASSPALSFAERVTAREQTAARVLDAIDRALTATEPGRRDAILDICLDVQQRRATVYEAADRIAAATGPGSGAPPEEHVGLRTAPACALTADECHRENGIPCAAHSHPLATPPSGGWATPSASGFPAPSAGELGFRKDLSATPPSGSPPGAAEATKVFPYGPPHKKACGCDFGRAATCGTKAEFIECGCVCHRASPPESPDGSRGTPPGEVDDQGRAWEFGQDGCPKCGVRNMRIDTEEAPDAPPSGER